MSSNPKCNSRLCRLGAYDKRLRGLNSSWHYRISLIVKTLCDISFLSVPITVGYNPVLYTTTEEQGFVVLNITIFDPPAGGTPRPFTLVVNTQDGTASMFSPVHIKCALITDYYRGRPSR